MVRRELRLDVTDCCDRDESIASEYEPFFDQVLAKLNSFGFIDGEDANGRSSDGRQSNEHSALPSKMTAPSLFSRIEQGHETLGLHVSRCQIRTFIEVASTTAKAPIRRSVAATVLPGNNMVEVKLCGGKERLGHLAVFATIARPRRNQYSQLRGHFWAFNSRRALD